jgi:2-keto-3-deoxy-L-arabinonate dehydratase
MTGRPYSGVFPILPTTFHDDGELDEASQLRAVDFLIDSGVHGFCILANFSEQWAITDSERERITDIVIQHNAGRAPIIVTTSHYSERIAAHRSRRAERDGAAMVMLMPPYHGTHKPDEHRVFDFFRRVADAITIPIMIQDAPISGVTLTPQFLTQLATEIPNIKYLKVEIQPAADKLRALVRLAGQHIEGPFDGEEGITMLPDLDAGATGTMPGGMIPEIHTRIFNLYRAGKRAEAMAEFHRALPLINYENKLCGLRATKALLHEGGIIASEATRPPVHPLSAETREGLLELARTVDPLALRYRSRK